MFDLVTSAVTSSEVSLGQEEQNFEISGVLDKTTESGPLSDHDRVVLVGLS